MLRVWIACAFVIAAADPALAQTRVRLAVEVETWLDPTPFDASREFTATLSEAGVEVSDDPAAPLLHIVYEETPGPGIGIRLVPATHIVLSFRVADASGEQYSSSRTVRPSLNLKTFPSAAELRVHAIDEFRRHESFRLLGHRVAALFGAESSFRALLSDHDPDTLFAAMLFRKVQWSPSNDDIFVRAFRALRVNDASLPAIVTDFLQRNLAAIQAVASDIPIASPQLALLFLEDYGERSARQVLTDLISHPLYGTSANRALRAINARGR